MSDNLNTDYLRQKGVSLAWKREREQVLNSRGSRNWTQAEQRQIISTGRCAGIEGQHMMSVKKHPEQADNPNNIQFLTHEEHLKAHGGNYKNDANGRYNRKTGQVEKFTSNDPGNTNYRKLTNPLNDRQKKLAEAKYNQNQQQSKTDHQNLKVSRSNSQNASKDNSITAKRDMFKKRASGQTQSRNININAAHMKQQNENKQGM